jgi:hypothetical protein
MKKGAVFSRIKKNREVRAEALCECHEERRGFFKD